MKVWPRALGRGSRFPRCLTLFPHLLDYLRTDETIQAWTRRDQRCIDILVSQIYLVSIPRRDGRFQPFAIVFFETITPGFRLGAARFRRFSRQRRHGEFRLVMSTTALITLQGPFQNRLGQREHVM